MNHLNIFLNKLCKNSDEFVLDDPPVYINIHEGAYIIERYSLGYLVLEKSLSIKSEYATATEGIPERTIRKDVIKQECIFEGKVRQFQREVIALLAQRKIFDNRVAVGGDVPPPVFLSVEIITKTVSGKEIRIRIRYGQMTAEDFQLMLGSKDYAEVPFKVEALIDENPLLHNPDWDYVGATSITGDLTKSSNQITNIIEDISNLKKGGAIFDIAYQLPYGTTISAIDAEQKTITLSNPYTGDSVEGAAITAENTNKDAVYDNILSITFEEAAA